MTTSPTSVPDLLQSGRDPVVFAEEILGVRLNPAQQRWFGNLVDGDQWRSHYSVHVAANQTGKSLGCAILVLWATIYKIGLPTDPPGDWAKAPYYWFHVAPSQNQAYIVLRDIELLVKGAHPAQTRCRLPEGLIHFQKVDTWYEGFTTLLGAEAQFRTTEDKARALQGRRANGITFDEAAFENHLKSVINEVLSMRLISTGGPLILVSTPNGINDYYEVVTAIREAGELVPDTDGKVWRTEEGQTVVWSTVDDNLGYGLSATEIERQERELDPATKEQQLRGAFLEPSEAFFVPQADILRAFRDDLPEFVEPKPGRAYIAFWDPSVASDPMAAYVLDVTRRPWTVVQEVWERKPSGFASLLSQMYGIHAQRSAAFDEVRGRSMVLTGYDSTGMGGKIVEQQLAGLTPRRGLDLAGQAKTKLDILGNLRAALLSGDLVIPATFTGLKRELLSYRLDDKKILQDRVMALAGAAWLAAKGFTGTRRAAFDPHAMTVRPAMR